MPGIGILELKNDEFINNVISRLSGMKTEFISLGELTIPSGLKYDVIVDRISSGNPFLTEIVKKLSLGGSYVINNPFSATNKIIDTFLCSALNIPHPKTMVLPFIDEQWDMGDTVREPDLERVGKEIGFPCVLKPYDGYAWDNVFFVNTMNELKNLYDSLKTRHVLLVQEKIEHNDYYRAFCINKKEVLLVKHKPRPRCQSEYLLSDLKEIESHIDKISKWSNRLNSSLDVDFNAMEWAIDLDGKPFIIDSFNEIPEIQRNVIPHDYYEWILDKFSAMVREKAEKGERNRTIFSL